MARNWTFGRILGVGYALAGLVLLLVAAVGYQSTSSLIENDELVNHTHQVRRELADLLSPLKDVETGQRGYVITGDESYLEPYQSALPGIRSAFERRSKAHLGQSRPAAQAADPLASDRRQARRAPANHRAAPDRRLRCSPQGGCQHSGKAFMDQIRAIVADADHEEARLLDRRCEGGDLERGMGEADHSLGWPDRDGSRRGDRLVHGRFADEADRHRRRPGAELVGRAAGGRQPAGHRREGAGHRDERDHDHDQRAARDLAPDRRERAAGRADRRADASRGARRRRHGRDGERVDRRDPPAGRPDRQPHARARQEVAADRRRARHRLRARRADQHPGHQRHHRGRRRRRRRQALRRRRRRDPQAGRPRRRARPRRSAA